MFLEVSVLSGVKIGLDGDGFSYTVMSKRLKEFLMTEDTKTLARCASRSIPLEQMVKSSSYQNTSPTASDLPVES